MLQNHHKLLGGFLEGHDRSLQWRPFVLLVTVRKPRLGGRHVVTPTVFIARRTRQHNRAALMI